MNANINESIYDLFKGEPLVELEDSLQKCPYCRRDFSNYNMMRKQCHIEACENSLRRRNGGKSENIVAHKTKKYTQTTLDCGVQNMYSGENSCNSSRKDIRFLAQKPSTSSLTKSKSVTSGNLKNFQICSCPYKKDHIKERVANLFVIYEKNSNENINFSSEPFISSKRLMHYEILARDFQKLTKRCCGDVTVKAKNGILKWHKIILQIRTKFPINDLIDLSEFEKESLLAYEKYIYGGEIRYSHHLLKDLKTLAKRYGPESLKYYLENDFIINEDSDYIEKYEIKRYSNALKLNENNSIETSARSDTNNQGIPNDSFNETMDYAVFNTKENHHLLDSSSLTNKKTMYETDLKEDTMNNINMSNEVVNETIQSEIDRDIELSNESDILEKNLVINSQEPNNLSREKSPTQNDITSLDREDSNIGVIVFDYESDIDNRTTELQSNFENLPHQCNDASYNNFDSPLHAYMDESFCGIIEGGYYSNESRSETPLNNINKSNFTDDKLPISEEGKDSLTNSIINKATITNYETPNINKTTNFNNLNEINVVKSKRQIIEQQLTKSSQLVKYTDITPQPMYEKMSDAELQVELAKYGIGKRGRKKAIIELTKIYNQLHPTVFVDNIIESPKGRKRKSQNNTQKCLLNNHDNHLPVHVEEDEANTSVDSLSSSQEEINILEESCTEFINTQEMDQSLNSKEKKPKTHLEWRSLFIEFIRLPENKLTFNRVLSYSTFELSEIYQLIKSSTHPIRYISKSVLVTILDELHISFTILNDSWETKAKKRKK